ncbi:MAG: glycosyltransferase family 2 protein [Lachnospiraceae bacterium]|nr:glycosyltransferase family 2 protein [Lachnospiraceae bacterium]
MEQKGKEEQVGRMEQKEKKMKQAAQPLISVIVPVYNIIEYLPRCVESICRQTYKNLEILLVDDGSTDGTGSLCDSLAKGDLRIRVFHKENGGSSSARNLGIANAKGEFLGFVDSDDYIEPDMYERLAEALLSHDGLMAQIGRDEIDEAGKRLPDICVPPKEFTAYSPEEFLRELLLHKGDCSFCTKLVAKALFSKEQFPVGVLNEDFHLLVGMLSKTDKIYSLPGYGYHVFYRMGSNTRKESREEFSRVYGDNVDNADMVLLLVQEKYPALKQIAVRFGLFQRLDYLLHIPIPQMVKSNGQYRECVRFIRSHMAAALTSRYLTGKNKLYLFLFGIMPRGIKKLHAGKQNKALKKAACKDL